MMPRKKPTPKKTPDPWESPPHALNDEALAWWEPVVALLRERGRLPEVMPLSVWLFCQLLDQFFRVTRIINTEGQILDIRDDKGVLKKSIPDPAFTVQSKLFDQLRRLVAELGLETRPGAKTNTQDNPQEDGTAAGDDRQAVLRRALQGFSLDNAGRG